MAAIDNEWELLLIGEIARGQLFNNKVIVPWVCIRCEVVNTNKLHSGEWVLTNLISNQL